MDKVIRNGQVAVIYSPDHGAGWYSWHKNVDLLFDPKIIDMIERKAEADEIEEYCQTAHDPNGYYGGAVTLSIKWLDIGTLFRVEEYDGAETIVTPDEYVWLTT